MRIFSYDKVTNKLTVPNIKFQLVLYHLENQERILEVDIKAANYFQVFILTSWQLHNDSAFPAQKIIFIKKNDSFWYISWNNMEFELINEERFDFVIKW